MPIGQWAGLVDHGTSKPAGGHLKGISRADDRDRGRIAALSTDFSKTNRESYF